MPDLAWQLMAISSISVCTALGLVARRAISRLDERRRSR